MTSVRTLRQNQLTIVYYSRCGNLAVVQDGETLAIGGIIADRQTRDRSGIPYLMDLPVLGRFFGTTSDNTTRTELVILITPHVVRNKEEARDVTAEFKSKLST